LDVAPTTINANTPALCTDTNEIHRALPIVQKEDMVVLFKQVF
jgi:hypothetical protein